MPAAIFSGRRFSSRTFPNHAAPAPRATNIAVKPATKAAVWPRHPARPRAELVEADARDEAEVAGNERERRTVDANATKPAAKASARPPGPSSITASTLAPAPCEGLRGGRRGVGHTRRRATPAPSRLLRAWNRPPAARARLRVPRRGRKPDRGRGGARTDPRARRPARLGAGLDLPLPIRPHPGGRHRRGGPAPVPLPRALAARGATGRSSRRCSASHGRCPGFARPPRSTSAGGRWAGSACSPAPSGCSTAASFASAPRTMRRRTRPTASPRCRSGTSARRRLRAYVRLSGQGREATGSVRRRPRRYRVVEALKKRRGGRPELLALQERAASGRTCARTTSTTTSRTSRTPTSRPRTSAPGTRPSSQLWLSPSPARRPARRPHARGRSHGRCRRSRSTSATRRPCAAPRTSTRGSSTVTGTGSRSAARWRS